MPALIQSGNEAVGASSSEQTVNVTITAVSATANCEIFFYNVKPVAGGTFIGIFDVQLTTTTNLQYKVHNNNEATKTFWQVTDWGA